MDCIGQRSVLCTSNVGNLHENYSIPTYSIFLTSKLKNYFLFINYVLVELSISFGSTMIEKLQN